MTDITLAAPPAADGALCLDFECRSARDLRKAGAHNWCQDPSFELLCAAYRLPSDDHVRVWARGEPLPAEIIEHIRAGRPVRAWNALFEFEVTQTEDAQKAGWPALSIGQLDCTMARAAACGLPQGLDECGTVLGMAHKKDAAGSLLMRSITHMRQSGLPIEPKRFDGLLRYCAQDVLAELSIAAVLPPLTEPEAQLWRLNAQINQRGLPIDLDLAGRAQTTALAAAAALDAELSVITGGAVPAASAVAKLKMFLGARGVPGFAQLDLDASDDEDDTSPNEATLQKHDIARLLGDDSIDPVAKRALEIRKAAGKAATKKYPALLARTAAGDGRLRGEYVYCGAATGRFASRGLQMHNLKRQPKGFDFVTIETALRAGQPVSLDDLSLSVRSMIAAPKGKTLLCLDYGQVEYRGVCWGAGEAERLDGLVRGELPYELIASRVYGVEIGEVTPDLRQRGKGITLGSGYQLGWLGLQALMSRMGRDMPDEEAQRSIQVFREAHPAVVRLWAEAERAAKTAMESRFAGCWVTWGAQKQMAFCLKDKWLLLRLPSGRLIRYYDPKIELRERFGRMSPALVAVRKSKHTHQYRHEQLYGGLCVENLTQGFCRDILAVAMMRLDRAGFDLIGHTHDEVIMLVDDHEVEQAAADAAALMTKPISWLPGFPLAVEAKIGKRYG